MNISLVDMGFTFEKEYTVFTHNKPFLIFFVISVSYLISSCALFSPSVVSSSRDIGSILNEAVSDPMDDNRMIPVYFATNRKERAGAPACNDLYYTPELADRIDYGVCQIYVPKRHSVGALDLSGSSYPDRNIHFITGNHNRYSPDDWIDELKKQKDKDIFLFVHGFNVKFEEAVVRTAQLKYDLKFQGDVVLFTWPAGSPDSILQSMLIRQTYKQNQGNAERSINPFASLLNELKSTGRTVHVMVHSMGHQIAIPAVLKRSGSLKLGELILNAPDYPADAFVTQAPTLLKVARRITLYCSPSDNALTASESVNSDIRLGRCSRVSGVDVINVNEVDDPVLGIGGLGHGYYSGRAILTDLQLLLWGVSVERRLFIRTSEPDRGENYILRK